MATDEQTRSARAANGVTGQARTRYCIEREIAVSHGATVKDGAVTLPGGSIFRGISLDTPTAISGSPTSANFRAGITDGGQEIVADVDAKAQGHIACTIVAALDKVAGFASATTIFLGLAVAGGTAEAGTVKVLIDYDGPLP